MFIIGVTGSLKTGKSTVAAMLKRKGATVIDADKLAHEVLAKQCFKKVVQTFGKDILEKGKINRRKLAGMVFNHPQKLKMLENIIHPAVIKEIKLRIQSSRRKKEGIVVLDVPLLFEAGLDREVDLTMVVTADKKTQIQRAMKQLNITRHEALKRIKAQMPLKNKIQYADWIIKNSRSKNDTQKEVNAIWQKILQQKRN
jgi:dephospho-CoA kinase